MTRVVERDASRSSWAVSIEDLGAEEAEGLRGFVGVHVAADGCVRISGFVRGTEGEAAVIGPQLLEAVANRLRAGGVRATDAR